MNQELSEPSEASSRGSWPNDFIREAIRGDLEAGRFDRVHTRFPPEPNAYLHIGHAKALWINFGIAAEFGGTFNLRFDDTNPIKEEQEFVDGIVEDVRWLLSGDVAGPPEGLVSPQEDGTHMARGPYFASDYFGQMYDWAVELVRKGSAFVCDLTAEQLNASRGTLTSPGTNSPYRNRSAAENLELFAGMRAGEFPDGAKTLRAKIDLGSPNMNLRDPVMYRILHADHHRQGDRWRIYPMYDWAHGLEDSVEAITHSLCSLEYENHRPLYDWFLDELGIYHPRQIEFARLNLTYTVMSKRRFIELVDGGHVSGYEDPRLPTLAGLRRRGYTPEAIKEFCRRIGTAKTDSVIEAHQLEDCIREDLNKRSPRVMAVLDPLKVVIENYPEGQVEQVECGNNPEDPSAGTRRVPFSREIYIERDDFREDPPPKFFRLALGREVRLRNAYFVRCENVVKDASGKIVELRCAYDPATRGGDAPDGRKVKATLHWVSTAHAVPIEARLYDHLFATPDPDDVEEGGSYISNLNRDSLRVASGWAEPSVGSLEVGARVQFERLGYFCVDRETDSRAAKGESPQLVFNRTATLRDAWARIERGSS